MSESALAGMYNSYGNNRNTIDRGRNDSLATLLDTLNSNKSTALQNYNNQLSADDQQKMAYQLQLEQALANQSAEILQNKYDTLQNLDNTYTQQMLALQQAQAEAAAKAASRRYSSGGGNSSVSTSQGDISNSGRAWMYKMDKTERITSLHSRCQKKIKKPRSNMRFLLRISRACFPVPMRNGSRRYTAFK